MYVFSPCEAIPLFIRRTKRVRSGLERLKESEVGPDGFEPLNEKIYNLTWRHNLLNDVTNSRDKFLNCRVSMIKRIYHVDEVRIGKTRGVNLLVWTESWRGPDGRFIPRVFPILTSSTWLIIYLAYSLFKLHINLKFLRSAHHLTFSA